MEAICKHFYFMISVALRKDVGHHSVHVGTSESTVRMEECYGRKYVRIGAVRYS